MKTDISARRLPAEWEAQGAVLLSWPHSETDWAYMLEEAQECYIRMIEAISRFAPVIVVAPDTAEPRGMLSGKDGGRGVFFFDVATNDTWIRDYGVITTVDADGRYILNDFAFNGWGGKFVSDKDNAVTARMYEAGVLPGVYNDALDFILEGGSIESDGFGTILTTESCLLTTTRNKGYKKEDIERRLREELGAERILWLKNGAILGDDTDGHIDTIARLAPGDTILYCGTGWCAASDFEQRDALAGVAEDLAQFKTTTANPYNLIELPMPTPIYDAEDGHRLPATYANFLIINKAVIMPTYGQPKNDEFAAMALKVAFPDYEIVGVDCRALIRQHGSLHCATMQLPQEIF